MNVVSFNVNGIRNESKRRAIFNYLKHFDSHIVLLQETHSTKEDEVIWSNEWGSKIHFCHGSNMSKGVALLIKRNMLINIGAIRCDLQGRFIIVEIEIGDIQFLLVNVYAPNEDDPTFFVKLFELIEQRENESIMLGGDWNTTLCIEKDLFNNKGLNHIRKREVLLEYIDQKGLIDIWRVQHPEDKIFTWKKPNSNSLIMSRLDFFLVSPDLALRINSSKIGTKYNSDHCRVSLNIDFSIAKRGPGYWKFNNLHLQDKTFIDLINKTILQFLYEVKNKDEAGLDKEWEALKDILTNKAKLYSKEKAKQRNQLIEKLEARILILDQKLINTKDEQLADKYKRDIKNTEQFLLDEHEIRVSAAKFRSKAQYFLLGEKNSRYFFNLERYRGNTKIVSQLVRQDGSIIKDPKKILKEEKIFYEKLYGASIPDSWPYANHTNAKLSEEEKISFDRELSDSEIGESLMGMANSKAPGLDGLTAEFYKTFWIHLKNIYCPTIRFVLERGLLHKSARLGLITLLPKKDKDLKYLSNWRPLTLLNVDFKIISRAIALRLKSKADSLISKDQTGFIQGRNISESLRTVLDVIQIANNKSLDMVIVSLDWDKCFDRISFDSVNHALEYFNFGEGFRNMVRTLLVNSESCVYNNGYCSEKFPIKTGVKQGSNTSPLLYVYLAEVLSNCIRQNTNIKGLTLGDTEHKLTQFADDMNLFLVFEYVTLMELEKELDIFEETTGMIVNYDKTCLYRVGSLRNSNAKLITRKPFMWSNGPIKILGIYVDHDVNKMLDLNFIPLLDKTRSICKQWIYRNLTLMGKALIVNSLCVSLFVYRLAVLQLLPIAFLDIFVDIVKSFLWSGGRSKIALPKLYNSKNLGGLKLVNLRAKDLALKCQWVSAAKENSSIRSLANYFLPNLGQDIWLCNFVSSDINQVFKQDRFWKDVAKAWAITYYSEPDNPTRIAAQVIWFNSKIKINKKLVYFEKAYKSGIMFLYNIWDRIRGGFLAYNHVQQVYGQDCLTYLQYYGIISAIPCEWIRDLKATRYIVDDFQLVYENFDGKMTAIVYDKITSQKKILSKLCEKWSSKFQFPIIYEEFLDHFDRIYKLTKSIKFQNFQFRFLHRVVFTANTLYKWKLTDSPLCYYCQNQYETIEHLFFNCTVTTRFWEMFRSWFECQTDSEINFTIEEVFFCNHEDQLLNILFLIAKQYIFNRRCLEKELNIYTYRDYMSEIIRIERYDAFLSKRFKPFVKKWKRLFF